MVKRQRFTAEFKREAVRLLDAGECPVSEMAIDLDAHYRFHGKIKLIDGAGLGSTCGQVQPDKAYCCAVHDAHCVGQFCIAAAEVATPVGPREWAIHVDMLVHGRHVSAAWSSRISAAGSVFCRRLQPLESGIAALGQKSGGRRSGVF